MLLLLWKGIWYTRSLIKGAICKNFTFKHSKLSVYNTVRNLTDIFDIFANLDLCWKNISGRKYALMYLDCVSRWTILTYSIFKMYCVLLSYSFICRNKRLMVQRCCTRKLRHKINTIKKNNMPQSVASSILITCIFHLILLHRFIVKCYIQCKVLLTHYVYVSLLRFY